MSLPSLLECQLYTDDRGYVHCVMDDIDKLGIKRLYVVENFSRGTVRAWHLHKTGSTYVQVLSGAAKVAALKYAPNVNTLEKPICFSLSARTPKVLHIPPGYYNGAMSLEDNTKLLFMSTLSFSAVKEDDARLDASVHDDIWIVRRR